MFGLQNGYCRIVIILSQNSLQCRRLGFDPWVGKIPWRRTWQSTPVFLPGEFHGQRSLGGFSPWDPKELDTTEWLTLHTFFSLHTCLHSNTTFNLADELFNITYNQPKKFESATSNITFSVVTEIFQNKGHQ